MCRGLEAVRQYAIDSYPVLEALADDVVEVAVAECLRDDPDGESLLGVLRETTHPEGVRRAMLAAADDVIASARAEGQLLEDKLDSLRLEGHGPEIYRYAPVAPFTY